MSVFILVWNPKRFPIDADDWAAEVDLIQGGGSHVGQWSTGKRKGGIELGDRCVLFRADNNRGIVAAGDAASVVHPDLHWNPKRAKKKELANYVSVEWTWQVPIEQRISVEVLRAKVPDAPWDNLIGSGVQLDDKSASKLEALLGTRSGAKPAVFPDEVDVFYEGPSKTVRVNRHERNPQARAACLAHFGAKCIVCGFEGEKKFGIAGQGLIHVHHLREKSTVKGEDKIDPVKDLVPVCPTCHAMIHSRRPAYTPDHVRKMLKKQ